MSLEPFGNISFQFIPLMNYEATAAPTINDDAGLGYAKGSQWVFAGEFYVCLDATIGAASWVAADNDVSDETISAHIGDATIHFTEGSIDHGNILGLADDDHTQYANATRLGNATYSANFLSLQVDSTVLDANLLTFPTTIGDKIIFYPVGAGSDYKMGVEGSGLFFNTNVNLNFKVDEVEIARIDVTGIIANSGYGFYGDGSNITLKSISGATYTTLDNARDVQQSTGIIDGGTITDGGAGTVNVSAGSVMIRSTNSEIGPLYSADFAGATGLALTDLSENFVYVEYNAGSPQIVASTTAPTEYNTIVILGYVYRNGTSTHISPDGPPTQQVGQHINRQLIDVDGIRRASGAVLSETGTRNIASTSGVFWLGLHPTNISARDTSVSDTFLYYYRDGLGGFTEVSAQTQISNSQYDDGTGTLATLGANKYGVHWVYDELDGDLAVVYGRGSYTLPQAEAATPPLTLPTQLNKKHAILIGKIIIQQGASVFTSVESAFDTSFSGSGVPDHGDLAGLGDDDHTQYANSTRLGNGTYTALDIAGDIRAQGALYTGTAAGVDGHLYIEGTGSNDFHLWASGTSFGAIDSQVNTYINIDSNNNQTGLVFQVGQDGTGSSGSPMLKLTEGVTDGTDSAFRIYGTSQFDGPVTMIDDLFVTHPIGSTIRNSEGDLTLSTGAGGQILIAGDNSVIITSTAGFISLTPSVGNAITLDTNTTIDGGVILNTGSITNTGAISATTTLHAGGIIDTDDTTDSTSGTTGSMHTDGGLGVVKNIFGGAAIHAVGIIDTDDTTDSTSGTTGSIHTDGGLGVAKKIYCADTTDATSSTTGAVQTPGGLVVQKNIISLVDTSSTKGVWLAEDGVTLGSTNASLRFTGIPTGWDGLRLEIYTRYLSAAGYYVRIGFNTDTTAANYVSDDLTRSTGVVVSRNINGINISGTGALVVMQQEIMIPSLSGSTDSKMIQMGDCYVIGGSQILKGGYWTPSSAAANITEIRIEVFNSITAATRYTSTDVVEVRAALYGITLDNSTRTDGLTTTYT